MGVVTIITFFVILLVVTLSMGAFTLGLAGWIAIAMVGLLGMGGLVGMLYLIEPERREQH